MVDAIGRDGGVGRLDLTAQILQPVAEEGVGLGVGVEFGGQLGAQIMVGEGVGDAGGLGRLVGGEADRHGIGQADPTHGQAAAHGLDHPLPRHGRVGRGRTAAGQAGQQRGPKSRVEGGVAGQAQVVHDGGGQLRRAQHLHLGVHDGGLGVQGPTGRRGRPQPEPCAC